VPTARYSYIATWHAIRIFPHMSTVPEIESAVENLTPQEAHAFAVWYEQRQALLNPADAIFQAYDEEEKKAAS
jgi:hypothetical protein